ncbi:MAG: SpoIIE family protein phosphatase, partial [Leptospiraceae bacterium]|nr:SpoIIE family protein phosphatase [Leptospiraceae bacterium]
MENDKNINILFIEDSEEDIELILRLLKKNNFTPIHTSVDSIQGLKNSISKNNFDIILADYSLPSFNGLEALEFIKSEKIDLPFILISGSVGEEIAVEAMRLGAVDYIMKHNMTRLLPAIEREIREFKIRLHRQQIQEILKEKNEQLKIAKIIQSGLFPQSPPKLAGFDIAGNSYPAEETGGDYFDFIQMLDNTIGLVVGDVSGHGLGPSLLMSSTRAYLRAFCLNFIDLGKILENLNHVLFEDISDRKRFVTLFLASLDPIEKSILFSSAGHTSGYIIDKDGQIKHELKSMNLPLGIQDSVKYE